MSRPTTLSPDDARRIAALIGELLFALLAALLGAGRGGARGAPCRVAEPGELEGVMAGVLRAAADADMTLEPYVEWVAVPAPWRNGRLLRPWHAVVPPHQVPARFDRPGALLHGPPLRGGKFEYRATGMARRRCAGVDARLGGERGRSPHNSHCGRPRGVIASRHNPRGD